MTRQAYLAQLMRHLKRLPKKDCLEAMDYFTELFDKVGTTGETALIEELGSPEEAAHEVLKNLLEEKLSSEYRSEKKHLIWIGLLAILAAPMAIPFVLLVIGFFTTLLALIVSFFLSLGLINLSLFLLGFSLLWDMVTIISSSIPLVFVSLGGGLLSLSLGGLLTLLIYQSSRITTIGVIRLLHILLKRGVGYAKMDY